MMPRFVLVGFFMLLSHGAWAAVITVGAQGSPNPFNGFTVSGDTLYQDFTINEFGRTVDLRLSVALLILLVGCFGCAVVVGHRRGRWFSGS